VNSMKAYADGLRRFGLTWARSIPDRSFAADQAQRVRGTFSLSRERRSWLYRLATWRLEVAKRFHLWWRGAGLARPGDVLDQIAGQREFPLGCSTRVGEAGLESRAEFLARENAEFGTDHTEASIGAEMRCEGARLDGAPLLFSEPGHRIRLGPGETLDITLPSGRTMARIVAISGEADLLVRLAR